MSEAVICPFCASGDGWNACRCQWALKATRIGLIEARKQFALLKPSVPAVVARIRAAKEINQERSVTPPEAPSTMMAQRPTAPETSVGVRQPSAPPFAAQTRINILNTQTYRIDAPKRLVSLAPEGECAYCDHRRALDVARQERFRKRGR